MLLNVWENIKMNEVEACQNFASFLVNLAKEEGEKFRKTYNREPTKLEAEQIANNIQRQLKTSLVLLKNSDIFDKNFLDKNG